MIPRAIFFDLDQTLIQHTRAFGAVLTESLGKLAPDRTESLPAFGIEMAASGARHWARVADCAGQGEQLMITMLTEALSASGFDPAFAPQLLQNLLQGIADSTRLTRNAVLTLDSLRARRVAIGVITNGLTILQSAKLRAHGLFDRIDAVVTSEDAGAHKPDPRIFERALTTLGVAPTEAWHVGDNYDKDIIGAHAAGMSGVLFAPLGISDTRRGDAERSDNDHRNGDQPRSEFARSNYPVISDLSELIRLASP